MNTKPTSSHDRYFAQEMRKDRLFQAAAVIFSCCWNTRSPYGAEPNTFYRDAVEHAFEIESRLEEKLKWWAADKENA